MKNHQFAVSTELLIFDVFGVSTADVTTAVKYDVSFKLILKFAWFFALLHGVRLCEFIYILFVDISTETPTLYYIQGAQGLFVFDCNHSHHPHLAIAIKFAFYYVALPFRYHS
jgi:hypothetical protein